jgi:hypothetical protein
MKRLTLVVAMTTTLLVASALPVGAAPTNGNSARQLTLECDGGESVVVLVQWETESAVAFDIAAGNGRQYVLSSLVFSVFAGDPPEGEPIFVQTKTWGQRNGYSERLNCTGSSVEVDPATGDVFTAGIDLVLASK